MLQAQKDRVTLTSWFGNRYDDLRKQVSGLMPAPAKAAPPPPPGGSVLIPAKGWSATVPVPAGFRLCMAATPRVQCRSDGAWQDGEACAKPDALRFRARRNKANIAYRFVPVGAAC